MVAFRARSHSSRMITSPQMRALRESWKNNPNRHSRGLCGQPHDVMLEPGGREHRHLRVSRQLPAPAGRWLVPLFSGRKGAERPRKEEDPPLRLTRCYRSDGRPNEDGLNTYGGAGARANRLLGQKAEMPPPPCSRAEPLQGGLGAERRRKGSHP